MILPGEAHIKALEISLCIDSHKLVTESVYVFLHPGVDDMGPVQEKPRIPGFFRSFLFSPFDEVEPFRLRRGLLQRMPSPPDEEVCRADIGLDDPQVSRFEFMDETLPAAKVLAEEDSDRLASLFPYPGFNSIKESLYRSAEEFDDESLMNVVEFLGKITHIENSQEGL